MVSKGINTLYGLTIFGASHYPVTIYTLVYRHIHKTRWFIEQRKWKRHLARQEERDDHDHEGC